jgi:hypothetical protein
MTNPQVYLNPRVGFEIGADLSFYRIPMPNDANDDVRRGFAEQAQKRLFYRGEADRFVRKWLQLRTGAWRRNREFSPDVTPDFIQKRDRTHCVVSGVEMTHGTGKDTDWSFDRLCNDGAYAPGNLVVISSRVNKLKGHLSALEILGLVEADKPWKGFLGRKLRGLPVSSAASR